MKFCSGHNYSINFLLLTTFPELEFFYPDKNSVPSGLYVDLVFKKLVLDSYESAKKGCRFSWTSSLGNYNKENDTYDGGIGLIADSKADFFMRQTDYYQADPRFVDFTQAFHSSRILPIQIIDKKLTNNSRSLFGLFNFLIPSFGFLALILAGLFVHFGSLILFSFATKSKRNALIQISTLSFVIFSFFMIQFFNVNLNTSNMIVDTSELLDSSEKFLKTVREPCFLEGGNEIEYFKKSPNESIPGRIYAKRNPNKVCVMVKNGKPAFLTIKNKFENIFFIVYDFFIPTVNRILQTFLRKDTFTNEQMSPYEMLRTFLMNKKLKNEIKNYLNKCVSAQLTFGFAKNFLSDFPNYTKFQYAPLGEHTSYTSLLDYINSNTIVASLSFDKLDYLFRAYFIILILLFIIFSIHHLTIVLIRYLLFYYYRSIIRLYLNTVHRCTLFH